MTFSVLLQETAFGKNPTVSGGNTHVSHLMLHPCHLHGHTHQGRGECSLGKVGVKHVRGVGDAIVGVGPVPAGAALLSLLGFFSSGS